MKLLNILSVAAMSSILLTACADTDITDITVDKPASMETNPVIDAYAPLKSYIDRSAHPDFKLGGALEASDYNKIGIVWRLANENFDELTAGNHMKYSFCVGADGSMNFSDVQKFVKNAAASGMSVYGHTLMWHAQQQNKYLNGLIADDEIDIDPNEKNEVVDQIISYEGLSEFPYYVMGYKPDIINGILTSHCPGDWHQYFVADGLSFTPGNTYKITAKMRGTKAGEVNVQLGNWGALIEQKMKFTEEWSEVSATFDGISTESGFSVFQPGVYDGTIEIEWVKLSHLETPAVSVDIEDYRINYGDYDKFPFYVMGYEPEFRDGLMYTSNPGGWYQYFAGDNVKTVAGTNYKVNVKIRSSKAGSFNVNMGDWSSAVSGTLRVSTEWEVQTVKMNNVPVNSCFVIFQPGSFDGDLELEWLTVTHEEAMNTIPKTEEEKYNILSAELYRWIDGMMEACEGQVVAWDVTNEVMSGSDQNGDGFYEPWSSSNTDDQFKADNFIWRDYLGELDVVRLPVKYARECFEKHGGDLSKLKLFVNDYNLESDWDNNAKVKSYAHWIPIWEEEEGVVIDGISSQMHISYYENEQTLESKKAHIKQMFEIMASTGKLVRVSELDMGYVDANGVSLKTPELTEDQHKAMAELYRWIIQTYFEVVPVNQQYGICHWCITDSPESSGWRGGEPVGLWDLDYNRKWTYTGFADGLAGK